MAPVCTKVIVLPIAGTSDQSDAGIAFRGNFGQQAGDQEMLGGALRARGIVIDGPDRHLVEDVVAADADHSGDLDLPDLGASVDGLEETRVLGALESLGESHSASEFDFEIDLVGEDELAEDDLGAIRHHVFGGIEDEGDVLVNVRCAVGITGDVVHGSGAARDVLAAFDLRTSVRVDGPEGRMPRPRKL